MTTPFVVLLRRRCRKPAHSRADSDYGFISHNLSIGQKRRKENGCVCDFIRRCELSGTLVPGMLFAFQAQRLNDECRRIAWIIVSQSDISIKTEFEQSGHNASFHFCQMLRDFVFMKTCVRTAWLFAAFPAFQIIRGIYRPAVLAGIVLYHLRIPLFVSGFPDSFLRFPKLDPVRHLCLKRSQAFTRILRALAAKVHPFVSGAFCHFADALTVIASFFRTASMAL